MQINNRKPKKPVMNIIFRVVISGLILVAGAAVMVALASMKTPPVEKTPPERALQVTAVEVAPEDVSVTITGYGEVKSLNVVTLSPEVAGRVVEVHPRLEPGEVIEAGELLFKIDPRDYAAAADQSRAAVSQLQPVDPAAGKAEKHRHPAPQDPGAQPRPGQETSSPA